MLLKVGVVGAEASVTFGPRLFSGFKVERGTEELKEVQMHFLEHEQAQHSPVELCIYVALGDHVQTDKRLPCTKIVFLLHKPNRRLPITVALTKPLTEDNFYWLPRILLLCLGWFRTTPISISVPATSIFILGRIREQCNY